MYSSVPSSLLSASLSMSAHLDARSASYLLLVGVAAILSFNVNIGSMANASCGMLGLSWSWIKAAGAFPNPFALYQPSHWALEGPGYI